MLLLGACTGGDGTGIGPTSTAPTVPPTVAPTTSTVAPTTTLVTDPAGAVTLRIKGRTLPGGTGLRVVVKATSPELTVRQRGAGAGVAVCPVAGVTAPPPDHCRVLAANGTVQLPFTGGVELRATGPDAAAEELTLTYVATDRTMTLVTPARPAGACAGRPCETTFSLVPGRAGPFTLDARGGGGRPRLVLTTAPAAGGQGRTLATVEGGGLLSIRATLEAGWDATLLHHEQGPDPMAAVTAEISWP